MFHPGDDRRSFHQQRPSRKEIQLLCLSRSPRQKIILDGEITITILSIVGDVVKIGIEAPPTVKIWRGELYDKIRRGVAPALRIFRPAA